MAKKETKDTSTVNDDLTVEQLKQQIEDLKNKVSSGEEEALKRVCKASGISYDEIIESEKRALAEEDQEMIDCNLGSYTVNINGKVYRGRVQVTRPVFQVIQQAIGDRRMRLLRELVGHDYLIEEVAGIGMRSKLIGKTNELGENIQ